MALGLPLDEGQVAALAHYRDFTLDWNRRVNLTALREPEAFERLGLVDALGVLRAVGAAEVAAARLVDIGSGAGLPGLPLAIVAPGLRLTLIEATGKKADFLRAAAAELGLPDVEVLHGRAEELAYRPDLRECFHLATARGLAELPALLELCLPFVRVGGRLLASKKRGIDAEVAAAGPALRHLGGAPAEGVPVGLPGLDDRQIIVVRKVAPTPMAYPRRPGLPAHRPIR